MFRRGRRKKQERSSRPVARGTTIGYEKPEVKTLTQGVTYRAGGLGFDETIGLASAAPLLEAMAAGDVSDHGLHAIGEHCARCGRAFLEDTPVRRTAAGTWVHDIC